jgi:hypothetical protein
MSTNIDVHHFFIGMKKWCKTINILLNGWKVMGSYILTLTMEEKLGREEEEKHFFL